MVYEHLNLFEHLNLLFWNGSEETKMTRKRMANYSSCSVMIFRTFVEHILTLSADITSIIKCKVSEWIASQATFIQALFSDISWES